jgi:hypothetical protein
MKISSKALLFLACISGSAAFSPNVSTPNHTAKDASADSAMAQYEAARKLASSSKAVASEDKVAKPTYSDVAFLQHIEEQHEAMEKYEAALRAALQSTSQISNPTSASSTQHDMLKEVVTQQESKLSQEQCWDTLTQDIHDIINEKEAKNGKPLNEEAKDEIIATAIAGSVLGTAVGSPLLVGAVLGYAGTQMLKGDDGDKTLQLLGKAKHQILSKAAIQAKAALKFTQEQWKEDQDLSSVTKTILKAIEDKANAVQQDVHDVPTFFVESVKRTVDSEDFRKLPNRTFNAFRDFLGSEEVQAFSRNTAKAIRDGLESEEMKALQKRASMIVQDAIRSDKK